MINKTKKQTKQKKQKKFLKSYDSNYRGKGKKRKNIKMRNNA